MSDDRIHSDVPEPTEARRGVIDRLVEGRHRAMVILEDIRDTHNAAAVYRSCDAFGVQRVSLIFQRVKAFDPLKDTNKTSSGANVWLDFQTFGATRDAVAAAKAEGYTVVATALTDEAEDIIEADLAEHDSVALMFGNEYRGLSDEAIALADRVVMIPMRGVVQSLNLSVSAAICLHELQRQRVRAGIDRYRLSEQERTALTERLIARRGVSPGLRTRG